MDRVIEMVRYIIEEPTFGSSAERSFKLPFIASKAFCVDSEFMVRTVIEDPQFRVLSKLMEFVSVPEEVQLNSTLCGYYNKVLSFWLIKKPGKVIEFLSKNSNLLFDLVDHIYLNSSIIDIIIRICCV